ncbi:nuclear pore complex Nup98-Nup96-like, partial [Paramuricea clavata]
MEDYQLGRKGPQASGTGTTTGTGMFGSSFGTSTGGSTFGTGGFGTSTATGIFGQSGQTNMFGAKTTSGGLFGNSSTTFSAPSAFTNTFGNKPGGLFGTTTTTPSTGLFGTTPAFGTASVGSSLFGTPSFGQTTQAGVFGASSQPGGMFGKPAFGTNTSGAGGLFGTSTFGQTSQPSLFGPKSTTGTLGTFGTTSTGGLFGTQNKPGFGTTFGTGTATNMFGNTTGTGLFGNSSLGFGTTGSTLGQTSTLGGTFGQTTLGGIGTGLVGQNNVAALQQQQQLQQQLQQQVLALTSSPFGDSPLFRNLTSRTRSDKPLSLASQAKQRGTNTPSQYKLSPRPSARVKPRAIGKLNFSQTRLFDGLDDEVEYSGETFVPRRSIKKLVLNSKSQTRSIASELSNSSQTNGKDREDSPETSHIRPASNGETSRDSFYSPKLNSSFGKDDQDSPVVGVRRSNIPRTLDEQDTGVNGEASTTQGEPLNAVGNEDKDSDDEQGPEPKQGETLEDQTQRNAGQRGCGVILERPEYYCNPTIAELDDMVDENGDVIVGDFVVGREGFGMVKFFGEFNVAGLNLDEIVSFRRREIEVYPDTYPDKPPVGEALNRKSEVTLYKVWPNDKTTRTPIKNPDRLRKVGWLEKLENATGRLGATFVDYQAETGTWIFTVDHFTRYGLKEVQIEMEDGSVTRPPLPSFHEDKEKLLEKARLEKEKAAIAMKMRLEEDLENRKKLMQEKVYDENSSFLEAQDDSQMTDISHETFP